MTLRVILDHEPGAWADFVSSHPAAVSISALSGAK